MKKLILSSVILMLAAVLSAQTYSWTNVVTLKLTDGNSDTYTSRFGEATDLTVSPSWGAIVANFEGATVKAYAIMNGVNYERLFLNSMTNTDLVVKTYNSTSLTFTLTANYGTISLYDKQTGVTTTVDKTSNPSDTYDCTVALNTTISDRFVLFYDAATCFSVTTNEDGYASYSNNLDLQVPAGLVAYKGAYNAASEELALTALANGIPANQGVFVKGAANTTYFFTAATATSDMSGNELVACVSRTDVSSVAEQVFCLRNVGGVSGLYQYTGQYVPAGKAYLPIATAAAPAPGRRVSIRVEAPTAVEAVAAEGKAEKVVRDGQLLILRDGKTYNVQGQIVK